MSTQSAASSARLSRPLKVLHCITSLDPDGAQHMLLKLCRNLSPNQLEFSILNLRGPTPFSKRFDELGVPVFHLGMRRALPTPSALFQIAKHIDRVKPDIVQGWMYHGNLAASSGYKLAKHKPALLWNIRKAVSDPSEYRPLTRLTLKIGARLSRYTEGVIYCGDYVAEQHLKLGYSAEKQITIPNGFDTEVFRPCSEAYSGLRTTLGLPPDACLVGMTARYHPHKDHPNFLRMAAIVRERFPQVKFALAGRGLDEDNGEIVSLAKSLGIKDSLFLLGERKDVQRLIPAFDIYCLSSSAEGFPNSLGEAMSCGVPCVTTDAGASAEAVGPSGKVVPKGNSEALANAVCEVLELAPEKRRELGDAARKRVLARFSLPVISQQYSDFYLAFGGKSLITKPASPVVESTVRSNSVSHDGVA